VIIIVCFLGLVIRKKKQNKFKEEADEIMGEVPNHAGSHPTVTDQPPGHISATNQQPFITQPQGAGHYNMQPIGYPPQMVQP